MSSANVCYILEFSELYDKAELRNECINLIIKQTSDVIITKDFLESNKIVLNAIVTQRELAISELDLFKSIHSWAYYNSKQNGIPIETYAISLADIINNIRFLTMKPIEFVEGPGSSFLLSAEEQLNLLKNIVKPGSRLLLERFCTSREYRR
uniref:BTB/POZ domain-containing protein 6-like n=1 Tax=Lycorma delicatula TaxID=130591 RepID=UPI003F512BEA